MGGRDEGFVVVDILDGLGQIRHCLMGFGALLGVMLIGTMAQCAE